MITLSSFKSVRARLLVLMAGITVPVAIMSVILASTTYRSVIRGIEAAQVQTTSNFVVRARIWFRGALRTTVSAVSAIQSVSASTDQCTAILSGIIDRIDGFEALQIRTQNGASCHASNNPALTAPVLDQLAGVQKTKPFTAVWNGASIADTRYDVTRVGGAMHVVVYARNDKAAQGAWEAVLLTKPDLLDQAFELGTMDGSNAIALIGDGGKIIAARGVDEADDSWLPKKQLIATDVTRWEGVSKGGDRFAFASQVLAEPDLFVLARFDDDASRAAWVQFLVLCLTPLLTLALLFAAYVQVIQTNVIHWITGIERAARARNQDASLRAIAPVNDAMPQDIRSVAEAFNAMVRDADDREMALKQSVEANRFLMRELHHRVKNSLQVIQSYLALSRRQQSGAQGIELAHTEAKVQVLSTAYRLALSDGGMRPVAIAIFAGEILDNLSSMRRPGQWIGTSIDVEAGLIVDRVIPFGLALVEGVVAGLTAPGTTKVMVTLATLEDGKVRVSIAADKSDHVISPYPKIMAGLAAQLEAEMEVKQEGDILRWRFSP